MGRNLVILSAGRDPELLTQWAGPLKAAGYQVFSAIAPEETMEHISNRGFDLVLLCYSLTKEERRRLLLLLRICAPSTPVVMIAENEGIDYEDGVRHVQAVPEQILAAVHTSLS